MTPIRRKIAKHLLNAQQNAALLTTFNEVDMSGVMDMRSQFKDAYAKKYGIKLGFMSFFVRACTQALAEVPAVGDTPWTAVAIGEAIAPYWEEHTVMPTDTHARGGGFFVLDDSRADRWPVSQTIADPAGHNEWVLEGEVDLAASRDEGRAVVRLGAIRRL